MSKKSGFELSGASELQKSLEKLGGEGLKIAEEAIHKTSKEVGRDAKSIIQSNNNIRTGKTYRAIIDGKALDVRLGKGKKGQVGSVNAGIGFDLRKGMGGRASIFLMFGTVRMSPTTGLYNTVFGADVVDRQIKHTEDLLNKAIKKF